jgi:cation transport ATPase
MEALSVVGPIRRRGLPGTLNGVKAGWLEVAMGATLVGSFLTISVDWAHLALGIALVALTAAHVGLRWRVYRAVLRRWRRRAVSSGALIGSAVVMTAAGFVQWGGVPAAIPWHGAGSLLLILLTVGHAARRLWRRRRRRRRQAGAGPGTLAR